MLVVCFYLLSLSVNSVPLLSLQNLLSDSEVLLKGMLEVSSWAPAAVCSTLRVRAHTYGPTHLITARQELPPTRFLSQKIIECLDYLAFNQEQDLHEEALWVTST